MIIVKQEYHDYHNYCFHFIFTGNWLQTCEAVLRCVKKWENCLISDNYHDIGRLLLLTIIVNSNNCTISIIVK